jgi:hypothetical protein
MAELEIVKPPPQAVKYVFTLTETEVRGLRNLMHAVDISFLQWQDLASLKTEIINSGVIWDSGTVRGHVTTGNNPHEPSDYPKWGT